MGSPPALFCKRALDVTVAASALVAAGPALLLIAAAVRWQMGSPVLFVQRRPGLAGRPFSLLKFRTMRDPLPDESWVHTDGERITPLGSFLRRTSLDELPQLWNVVRGDMSLVGPRPLLMAYLERYTEEQHRRHHMRPGITGLAQVRGRNAIPFSERLRLDVWYVDHWSLGLDLRILGETFWGVLRREGVEEAQSLADLDDLGLTGAVTPGTARG